MFCFRKSESWAYTTFKDISNEKKKNAKIIEDLIKKKGKEREYID